MKVDKKILNRCVQLADYSKHKQKIGCVITDKKNKPLSEGKILLKTHPVQSKFGSICNKSKKIYLHAEMDAMIKNKTSNEHILYVIRKNKNNDFLKCIPCDICMSAIITTNIKYIVYSENENKINILTLY